MNKPVKLLTCLSILSMLGNIPVWAAGTMPVQTVIYSKENKSDVEFTVNADNIDKVYFDVAEEIPSDQWSFSGNTLKVSKEYADRWEVGTYPVKVTLKDGEILEGSTFKVVTDKIPPSVVEQELKYDINDKKDFVFLVNPGSFEVKGVTLTTSKVPNESWTYKDGAVTIPWEYMSSIDVGAYNVVVDFSDESSSIAARLAVSDTRIKEPAIEMAEKVFNANSPEDISFWFDLGAAEKITEVSVPHTISGNNIVISKDYLKTLENNTYTITVKFSDGSVKSDAKIKVENSTGTSTGGKPPSDFSTEVVIGKDKIPDDGRAEAYVPAQTINYDLAKQVPFTVTVYPRDSVVENVYIDYCPVEVYGASYDCSDSQILIRRIEALVYKVGNHPIAVKLKNGKMLEGANIVVTDSEPTAPKLSEHVFEFDVQRPSNIFIGYNTENTSANKVSEVSIPSVIEDKIVTLEKSYLCTLSSGEYEVKITFDNGSSDIVRVKVVNSDENPVINIKEYSYTKGSNTDLDIAIKLNGHTVTDIISGNNKVDFKSDDTKITLSKESMDKLGVGDYKFSIRFKDCESINDVIIHVTESDISDDKAVYIKEDDNDVSYNCSQVENVSVPYEISGDKVVIKKDYLKTLDLGQYKITITLKDGTTKPCTLYVRTKESVNPVLLTSEVFFFKDSSDAISFDLDSKGYEISEVNISGKVPYNYVDGVVTVESTSLKNLEVGTYPITVSFVGAPRVSTELYVMNSAKDKPHILSTDLVYDLNSPTDIVVKYYTPDVGIKSVSMPYDRVGGNTLQIKSSYLKGLSVGDYKLLVEFQDGTKSETTLKVKRGDTSNSKPNGGNTSTSTPNRGSGSSRPSSSSSSSSTKSNSNNTVTTTAPYFNADGSWKAKYKPTVQNLGGHWDKDSTGQWIYILADGTQAKNRWIADGKNWYWLNQAGYIHTGWLYDFNTKDWFILDDSGALVYGWYFESQDGKWYFISPKNGNLLTGWQFIEGNWYFFTNVSEEPTYYQDANNKWRYNNLSVKTPFGSMLVNSYTSDNYFVNASGVWVK